MMAADLHGGATNVCVCGVHSRIVVFLLIASLFKNRDPDKCRYDLITKECMMDLEERVINSSRNFF